MFLFVFLVMCWVSGTFNVFEKATKLMTNKASSKLDILDFSTLLQIWDLFSLESRIMKKYNVSYIYWALTHIKQRQ